MGTRSVELPEEVVAAAEAVARASDKSVTDVIAVSIKDAERYLLVSGKLRPAVKIVTPVDRSREMDWTKRNRLPYAGKWVALSGDRLITSGDDGHKVYLEARDAGVQSPMLVHMPPAEEIPWGGL